MNQSDATDSDSPMLDEYDFSRGVRGRYARSYADGVRILVFDETPASKIDASLPPDEIDRTA